MPMIILQAWIFKTKLKKIIKYILVTITRLPFIMFDKKQKIKKKLYIQGFPQRSSGRSIWSNLPSKESFETIVPSLDKES